MTTISPEVTAIGHELKAMLSATGEPPRHRMKTPEKAVEYAMLTNDLPLLKSYKRSFENQRGIVCGHFMHPELEERGYDNIEDYMVPWRHDLRTELLTVMKKLPGTMNEDGLVRPAQDCIVHAYASDTEDEAVFAASLIKHRAITDPEQLRQITAQYKDYAPAITDGII
jgi:hypothetical protein